MPRGDKSAKFAELRALRQSGKKPEYRVEDVQDLYEEVDENEYKKIVRQRLNRDDFVVDDNGEGYADDGREEWDRVPACQSDSEEEDLPTYGKKDNKAKKKQQEEEQSKRDANDRDITEYFTKGAAKPQPKKTKIVKTEEDDRFLADLLGEVDTNTPAPAARSSKKRDRSRERAKARVRSPIRETKQPVAKKVKIVDERQAPTPSDDDNMMVDQDDDFIPAPALEEETPAAAPARALADLAMSDPAPSSPAAKAAERKSRAKQEQDENEDEDEDEDEDMMEVSHAGAITSGSVNLAASRPAKPIPKKAQVLPTPSVSSNNAPDATIDASSWNEINQKLNVISSSPVAGRSIGKTDYKDAVEEDGSLRMFWTDYTEVSGSLYLFGKVLNKKTKHHVSCFLKVENILRKLFFLPREGAELLDVSNEIDEIMTRLDVSMHKIKPCTRKYAFELPNMPKEAQYIKCLYPYAKPQIDAKKTGETFSHVFGTGTALFEQFVLWKNIMGPCWLKIEDANFDKMRNASHCRLEVLAEHPDMVSVMSEAEAPETPPMTIMSIAMRTAFNAKDNKQEMLALSARVYEDVLLSDPTPADKLISRTFTIIRPHRTAFPFGFEKLARDRKKGLIKLMRSEHEILAFFLAQVDLADPDVILGHQLEGVDYSVLLNRLHESKVHQWSRLGRLKRTQWPASLARVGGNVFAERQIMSGRLLCDLANDAGKSAMLNCQSWSLTEMCSLYLSGADTRRRDVDNELALRTWATKPDGLMDYVSHMETDTYFIAALALRVQILPLTQVLTNLAGNSWARTLTGTRAERNEFILLHEFTRNKYICPDKQFGGNRGRPGNENADEEGGGEGAKKKDKYKGGLVFEPEKGLYDKFVLVMDFNSLYPSIIQEFNICFTTVDRTSVSQDEDKVPEVPTAQDQGILPRLISTLVSRRREVKKLMKDKTATPAQLQTWDIKQFALKMTANSMYGCLGYTKSRFYARPLAVLTTYKGREILRSTKELAESRTLQVLYGDTDSVMINANVDNVIDAIKVANEFKAEVNKRYRLLEIDTDNIFRRILLQAKKKYAAINMVETTNPQGQRTWVEKMEVKGLDMRRREYCALSKEISSRLLNEILSGDDPEVSVQRIHEYLRETVGRMREGAIPPHKYIIHTQLGKAPNEYPNGDTMPQVQVALREIARGKTVRRGDVVPYIIAVAAPKEKEMDKDKEAAAKGAGDASAAAKAMSTTASSSENAAKRAHSPQDVIKADSGLRPDVEWYVAKQIFPPVERLCANITGTSAAQLAENLGLDIRRYGNTSSGSAGGKSSDDLAIHPLESQMPDSVRFRDCERLTLRCRGCKAAAPFGGLQQHLDGAEEEQQQKAQAGGQKPAEPHHHHHVTHAGVSCHACGTVMSTLTVVAQVERAARLAQARYYEGWTVCSEPGCGARTRQVGVLGAAKCPRGAGMAANAGSDCTGRMRYEMGERDMYNQLLYFASVWDVDRAKRKADKELARTKNKSNNNTSTERGGADDGDKEKEAAAGKLSADEVRVLVEKNRKRFGAVKGVVDRYVDKCGRQWVAMDRLFERLGLAGPTA